MRYPVKLNATEWQAMIEALANDGLIKSDWKSYLDVKDQTIEFEFEPTSELIEGRYIPLQILREKSEEAMRQMMEKFGVK